MVNVGADERIIVQRAAYAEPEPPPDPDPPPTGPVRIATAPTNGSDATAGLNADIRATPDGGTLQLVAGASYRVDGTIGQDNRNGLTLDGRGARLYQAVQRSGPLILFEHGGNDIHLQGTWSSKAPTSTPPSATPPSTATASPSAGAALAR